MNILILGANGSGKSVYAEKLIVQRGSGVLYYIATMIPFGEEGSARVAKHRKQREGMGFITIEKTAGLAEIEFPPVVSVLLEDVSNLLGNAMFENHCGNADSVFRELTGMCAKCDTAVLVSIDGLTAGPEYDAGTCGYINALNDLNDRLFHFADMVIIMRDGREEIIKK